MTTPISSVKPLSKNISELFWKIVAWISIVFLSFIAYSSQNIYHGAMDGKEAKIENVKQQMQIDSICQKNTIFQLYITLMQEEQKEFKQDVKEIKSMLMDIYKNKKY